MTKPASDAAAYALDPQLGGIAAHFSRIARRFPARDAVSVDGETITYRDLNAASNRLAHALLARFGPAPAPVALYFEPDIAWATALLAVLKAGKFYVPLDPNHPPARTAAIYAAAQPQLVLTTRRFRPRLAPLLDPADAVLVVDDLETVDASDGTSADPDLHVPASALLNVMFTSGSTGRPKGVIQTQANILNNVQTSLDVFWFSGADRVSQLMSPSFGASVSDTLGAWLTGATLLPYDLKRRGIDALAQWLLDEQITIYHSVPTVFRRLLQTITPETRFPALRVIKLGGEAVFHSDVAGFKRHFPRGCLLRNSLGSTETYMATWLLIDHDTEIDLSVVPIGRPTPGTRIHLWDDDRRPVAPGTVGQIGVESTYLSPGYWDDDASTAAAYVTDPVGGGRVYLTGDLGRLLPDGNLVHLGREDDQVKINGARVEIAEVEVALLAVPGVREAAVMAQPKPDGTPALVGYVVVAPEDGPTVADLRAALADKLPLTMVPAAFVLLETLPLLPFGKINRKALPLPTWERTTPFAAPETPVQVELAALWGDILGRERVGLDDDFFALGGDSLRATQFATRVQAAFGVDLSLRALFDAPTVRQMADHIVSAQLEELSGGDLEALLAAVESLDDGDIEALLDEDGAGGEVAADERS